MQDELKKVISEAMDTKSEFQQELTEQIPQSELSDEALESVDGGVLWSAVCGKILWSAVCGRNANKLA
ncbi:bacteriocin class II family protein [Scytonema sp. NUACC26]|uniref:bacteriocin class II family protein n=1 Tax=Scytonema sp. NUACC26 TaxID=3140176 RepID=UPI0034DBA78F